MQQGGGGNHVNIWCLLHLMEVAWMVWSEFSGRFWTIESNGGVYYFERGGIGVVYHFKGVTLGGIYYFERGDIWGCLCI